MSTVSSLKNFIFSTNLVGGATKTVNNDKQVIIDSFINGEHDAYGSFIDETNQNITINKGRQGLEENVNIDDEKLLVKLLEAYIIHLISEKFGGKDADFYRSHMVKFISFDNPRLVVINNQILLNSNTASSMNIINYLNIALKFYYDKF